MDYYLWMKKEGYRPPLSDTPRSLGRLSKTADFLDAEAIKAEIASKDWSEGVRSRVRVYVVTMRLLSR